MESLIHIENLKKQYGEDLVLNIDWLALKPGQSVGLVGNNGAGKTTLFRCILDLIEPTMGTVHSKGQNVKGSEHWKGYTGSYIDEGFLIDYLTPDEYFEFLGKIHQVSQGDLTQLLDRFEELFKGEIRGKKKYLRDLSKGNQKKVGIVGALIGNPEILLLDEPFANLDPSTQYLLRDTLRKLDEETDITLFISSHDLVHVTEFCQRILILDHGLLIKDLETNTNTLSELEEFFKHKINPDQNGDSVPNQVPE